MKVRDVSRCYDVETKQDKDRDIPKGYKKTEIGIIPEDWDVNQLNDITEIIMGQSPIGTSYNKNEKGIPLINGPTEFTKKSPIKIQWTTAPTKICKNNDVLLCVRGSSTGRINIADGEYCIGRGVAAIRNRKNSNASFIIYKIEKAIFDILSLTTGSTFPNIDGKSIRQIKIGVPPLPEQKAIAAVLSDTDVLITSLEKLIEKKKLIKQGAMQELFTGKRRLTGFEGKWKIKKFGEVVNVHRQNVMPWHNPKITYEHYSLPSFDAGKEPSFEMGETIKSNKFSVPLNSILISKLNPRIPRIWMPKRIGNNAISSTEFIVITNKDDVSRQFLYWICSDSKFIAKLKLDATGTTGSHQRINPSDVLNIDIKFPFSKDEQNAISQILSNMDSEIESLERKLQKYRDIKQGMMQTLLTGKIRLVSGKK